MLSLLLTHQLIRLTLEFTIMLRWTVCFAVVAAMFATTTQVEAQRRAPLRNLFRNIGAGWGAGNHWQNPGHNTGYYNPHGDQYFSDNGFANQGEWQYQAQPGMISSGRINQSPVGQTNNGQIIQAPDQDQPRYQEAVPGQPATPKPPQPSAENQDNSASYMLNNQKPYSNIRHSQQGIPGQTIQGQQFQRQPIGNQQFQGQPIQNQQIQRPSTPQSGINQSIGDQTMINRHLKPFHTNASSGSIQINQGGQFQISPIAPARTPGTSTGWTGQQTINKGQMINRGK